MTQVKSNNKTIEIESPRKILAKQIKRDEAYKEWKKTKKKIKKRDNKEDNQKNNSIDYLSGLFSSFSKSFFIDPHVLRGNSFVNAEADRESKKLATVGTLTNWLGTIGISPILFFSMSSFGIASFPLSLLFLWIINCLQNEYTVSVVKPDFQKGRAKYLPYIGIVGMQVLLTFSSVIGVLTLNSKQTLSEYYAQKLAEEKREAILTQKERALNSPETIEIKNRCVKGKEDIKKATKENSPDRDRFIRETHGSYSETIRLGVNSLPDSYCGIWNKRRQEIEIENKNRLQPHNEAESAGKTGTTILKEIYPDEYNIHFKEDLVADGNTLISTAFEYSLNELLFKLDIAPLGTSLLFLLLSLISSSALIIEIVKIKKNYWIEVSYSESVAELVRYFFEGYTSDIDIESESKTIETIAKYYQKYVFLGEVVTVPLLLDYVSKALNEGQIELTPVDNSQEEEERDLLEILDQQFNNIRYLLIPFNYLHQPHILERYDEEVLDKIFASLSIALPKLNDNLCIISHQLQERGIDSTRLSQQIELTLELLAPNILKRQLKNLTPSSLPSFLVSRFHALDKLQNQCHQLLKK